MRSGSIGVTKGIPYMAMNPQPPSSSPSDWVPVLKGSILANPSSLHCTWVPEQPNIKVVTACGA